MSLHVSRSYVLIRLAIPFPADSLHVNVYAQGKRCATQCICVRMCVHESGTCLGSFVLGDAVIFICVCVNQVCGHCYFCWILHLCVSTLIRSMVSVICAK
jgi:hypothetical protein